MPRQRWVLGNWKQNHLPEAAAACARTLAEGLVGAAADVRVGVAPAYLSIAATRPACRPATDLWLFAQDVAAQDEGAFTGEVGPAMIAAAGCAGSIVGHSERRALFGDTDALVAAKLRACLEAGLHAVLCVGERLESRDAGSHESVVISQLSAALDDLSPELVGARLVLAYEPVWAIGTGRTATPEQAAAMHRCIRAWLGERFADAGRDRSVLYGGSVKPDNAGALVAAGDIDGFLVGGASLQAPSLLAIARATAHVP
ncbi:MAG: triose-phosphate isomerase [Deltaproteobacteria bacterium]|nr:triose-phosphate isomerase [Deltaproteobacteria bacterium]MBK8237752.1 triose-phosphate isomerase [Deltaproteobacteria bacterium]MBK8720124.1 triose-phosphate isomerase [Deltaproteobacteria bacterium]MBP7289073.1 triose-phosphate isomerase [Nannocystaceae bacterium]